MHLLSTRILKEKLGGRWGRGSQTEGSWEGGGGG